MYQKILFGICLTGYCEHLFQFALNLAIKNDARRWITHGLGRINVGEGDAAGMLEPSGQAGRSRLAEDFPCKRFIVADRRNALIEKLFSIA